MGEIGDGGDFDKLREACVSHMLSLTSPRDSCRSAAVSTAFRSAADSDTVWERFLPPEYKRILDRAVDPIECSSKRDLYFKLCDPILIDGGKMSFQLERSSGAMLYMISAKELGIVWGHTPRYWKWIPVADSSFDTRFPEVARLSKVCWQEIHGKIETQTLSPKTNYAAYLIFKIDPDSHGLPVQETSIKIGPHEVKHKICLQPREPWARRFFYAMLEPFLISSQHDEEIERLPRSRDDGWLELEMGEFFNDKGEDGEVDVCLMEVKGSWHWKCRLTVLGIEVRPKK